MSLLAGAAEIDITPPMGVEMCGYGRYEKRVCTSVLDPLFARVLWLRCGEQRVAIVSVDVAAIDWTLRQQIVTEIGKRTGAAPDSVMLAATHTHSAPAVQHLIAWGEPDAEYRKTLAKRIIDAVERAAKHAEPAKLGCVRQRVHHISVNREQPDLGPLDPAAQLMRVDRADGSVLAVVYNFGAHPTSRYPFTSRISADWPGVIAAKIKVGFPGATPIFLQGSCGDINFTQMTFERSDPAGQQRRSDAWLASMAERFWPQIAPGIQAVVQAGVEQLSSRLEMIDLPCVGPPRSASEEVIAKNQPLADSMTLAQLRPLHERMESETQAEKDWRGARYEVDAHRRRLELLDSGMTHERVPVQVLRIGDAAIVGWPAEVYVQLGIELRQRSPAPMTFVATFANHTVGYVPTYAAYESQGKPNQFGLYPTTFTPGLYGHLPFAWDVGSVLVEKTLEIL